MTKGQPMHVIVVPFSEAAKSMTSRCPPGYRWAASSNAGLPADKMRLTFLPESAFRTDAEPGNDK